MKRESRTWDIGGGTGAWNGQPVASMGGGGGSSSSIINSSSGDPKRLVALASSFYLIIGPLPRPV